MELRLMNVSSLNHRPLCEGILSLYTSYSDDSTSFFISCVFLRDKKNLFKRISRFHFLFFFENQHSWHFILENILFRRFNVLFHRSTFSFVICIILCNKKFIQTNFKMLFFSFRGKSTLKALYSSIRLVSTIQRLSSLFASFCEITNLFRRISRFYFYFSWKM